MLSSLNTEAELERGVKLEEEHATRNHQECRLSAGVSVQLTWSHCINVIHVCTTHHYLVLVLHSKTNFHFTPHADTRHFERELENTETEREGTHEHPNWLIRNSSSRVIVLVPNVMRPI